MGAPTAHAPAASGPTAAGSESPEILKPPQDKRLYRRIQLASGMHVLLISDPEMSHSLEEDPETDAQPKAEAMEGDAGEGTDSGSEEARCLRTH